MGEPGALLGLVFLVIRPERRWETGTSGSFLKATCLLGPVLSALPTACQLLLPLSSGFYSDSALKPKIEYAISLFQTASWSLTDSMSFTLTPWKCSYTCLSVIYPRIKSCTRGGEVAPADGLPRDPAAARSGSPGTNLCTGLRATVFTAAARPE